ncbi:hypothetical protein GCM10027275_42040 [Rhabdobacter roseus]|uniref:T9SS type A sorting domain-containing protein n=1 Tax=Rhabdobacter roseus TaxID=1655419 RepID=A0A840TX44_9BACT|nr:hypothetical protein [Rhabdobacter roseus]MBB5286182.1 hypothetical protein [Rhabdobacter roseus]
MKTLKNSGMALMVALVASASVLAQNETNQPLENQAVTSAPISHYQQPVAQRITGPDSYADLRRKKFGQGTNYLNVHKLPATALLSAMQKPKANELTTHGNPPAGTFDFSMYRIQQSMRIQLMVEKKAGEKVVVRLLNQHGDILHEELIGRLTQRYARSFDFSQLQDGQYSVQVKNGKEVKQKAINLNTTPAEATPARSLPLTKCQG